jgi:hypothetical protein
VNYYRTELGFSIRYRLFRDPEPRQSWCLGKGCDEQHAFLTSTSDVVSSRHCGYATTPLPLTISAGAFAKTKNNGEIDSCASLIYSHGDFNNMRECEGASMVIGTDEGHASTYFASRSAAAVSASATAAWAYSGRRAVSRLLDHE